MGQKYTYYHLTEKVNAMTENTTMINEINEELVQRAIQGDAAAVSDLLRLSAKSVLFYTTKMLRTQMDAEDAAQEALLRICSRIGQLQDPKKYKYWLNTIVANETRQYMLKNYKQNLDTDLDDLPEIEETDETVLPQQQLERTETHTLIMGIIDSLPPRQKEAVMLHYYSDLSVTEVAEAMGIGHPNASKYISRAHEKIKAELERYESRGGVIMGGLAALPLSNQIGTSLIADADALFLGSEVWVTQIVEQCAVEFTVAAAESIGVLAGSAATLKTILVTAAAALAFTGVAAGVFLSTLEPPPPPTPPPAQVIQSADDTAGEIVFVGGQEAEHINPVSATVWATNEYGDLRPQNWWITPADSSAVLYSGYVGVVTGVFEQMKLNDMEGGFILHVMMEDGVGDEYILDREFRIQAN